MWVRRACAGPAQAMARHGEARQRCSEVRRGGPGLVRRRGRRRAGSRHLGAPRAKPSSAKVREGRASAHRCSDRRRRTAQKVNVVLRRRRCGSKLGKSMAHGERPRGWLLERLLRWQRRGVVLRGDQTGQYGWYRVDGGEQRRGTHRGRQGRAPTVGRHCARFLGKLRWGYGLGRCRVR